MRACTYRDGKPLAMTNAFDKTMLGLPSTPGSRVS